MNKEKPSTKVVRSEGPADGPIKTIQPEVLTPINNSFEVRCNVALKQASAIRDMINTFSENPALRQAIIVQLKRLETVLKGESDNV